MAAKQARQPVSVPIKLPVLDQYLEELHGNKPLSTVTQHLAASLYRGHGPQPLPAAVQSFYTGPAVKVPETVPSEPLSPSSAKYAHVASRIVSGRKPLLPRLPAPTDHTTLTHGVQVYDPADPYDPGSASAAGPHSKSPAVTDPAATAPDHAQSATTAAGASTGRLIRRPGNRRLAHSSTLSSSQTSLSTLAGATAPTQPGRGSAQVQKYVLDVGKMMDRVKAGQVLVEKIQAAAGQAAPAPGMFPAFDPNAGQRARRKSTSRTMEDTMVQVFSTVVLPAGVGQQRLAGSGKGQGAALMTEILKQQGYARTDMRKILDQLEHFAGQDTALVQGLADRMQVFSYPPAYLLYAKGTVCNEMMVLLSGYLMLYPDKGPPQRLSPGTVLGVQLMTQRLHMPCDVRTDPNFEAHVAGISWQEYEAQMGVWAADRVLALTPGLQFSVETRLKAAVAQGQHTHCQPGQALCFQEEDADSLILLVKGQVLVTEQAGPDVVQSEGQVVQQLRSAMGETSTIVPTEMPRMPGNRRGSETGLVATARRLSQVGAPRISFTGGRRATSSLSGAVGLPGSDSQGQITQERSPSRLAPIPDQPHAEQDTHTNVAQQQPIQAVSEASASQTDVLQPVRIQPPSDGQSGPMHADSGSTGLEHGHGLLTVQLPELSPRPPAPQLQFELDSDSPSAVNLSVRTPIAGVVRPHPQHTAESEPTLLSHASVSHDLHAALPPTMSVADVHNDVPLAASGPSFAFGMPDAGPAPGTPPVVGQGQLDAPGQPEGQPPPAGVSQDVEGPYPQAPNSEPAPPEPSPLSQQPTDEPTLSDPLDVPAPGEAGTATAVSTCPSPHNQTPITTRPGSSAATSDLYTNATTPRMSPYPIGPVPGALEMQRAFEDGYKLVHDQYSQGGVGTPARSSLAGVSQADSHSPSPTEDTPATPDPPQTSTFAQANEQAGSHQHGLPAVAAPQAVSQPAFGVSKSAGSLQDGEQSKSQQTLSSDPSQQSATAEKPSAAPRNAKGSKGSRLAPKADAASEVSTQPAPPLPTVKGMPLYNALAAIIRANKQQVVAVHSTSLFLGEECLIPGVQRTPRRYTILATQAVEYIRIPRASLASILPSSTLPSAQKKMASQQILAAMQGGSKRGVQRWPEAAGQLREYLMTPPGSRAPWQVEALADGFSSLPCMAALPWQARVRIFQDLALMVLPPGAPGVSLGRTVISVIDDAEGAARASLGLNQVPDELYDALGSEGGRPSDDPNGRPDSSDSVDRQLHGHHDAFPMPGHHASDAGESSGTSSQVGRYVDRSQSMPAAHRRPRHVDAPGFLSMHPSMVPPGQAGHSHDVPDSPQPGSYRDEQGSLGSDGTDARRIPQLNPASNPADSDGFATPRMPAEFEHCEALESGSVWDNMSDLQPQQGPGSPRYGMPGPRSPVHGLLASQGSLGSLGLDREIPRGQIDVPSLGLDGLRVQTVTPGTDRVGGLTAWDERSKEGNIPEGYQAYDLQPHHHVAVLAAQQRHDSRLTSPDMSTRPTTADYALSSGRAPASETDSPEPVPTIPEGQEQEETSAAVQGLEWRPKSVHTINLKTDDNLYFVISGEVALAAVLQPEHPGRATADVQQALTAAAQLRSTLASMPEESGEAWDLSACDWQDPLLPVVLATVNMGASFSAASALTAADMQPPGAAARMDSARAAAAMFASAGTSPAHVPAIAGTRQVMAVQQGDVLAEVLCMSRPLFMLSLTAGARMAYLEEVIGCLQRSPWAHTLWENMHPEAEDYLVSPGRAGGRGRNALTSVASWLQGSCRVEEYKQGTELLRRAEPAPTVYFVLEGEMVLSAAYVGLADTNSGAAPLHELTRIKEYGCCGELSLLASRPLWYSLMVCSSSARVLCVDMAGLRELVAELVTPQGAAELLKAVATLDLELYATAIQRQAQKLAAGELELGLFNAATRQLLLQVLDLGQLEQSDMQAAVKLAVKPGQPGGAKGEDPDNQGHCVIIVENSDKVEAVLSSLARQAPVQGTLLEREALKKTEKHIQEESHFMQDMNKGSAVTNIPAALPVAMSVGPALLNQSMALYASQASGMASAAWGMGTPAGQGTEAVLRITMPNASTQELAYMRPTPVRPPKQFDLRSTPKALTGMEIEANRVPQEDALPLSVLTAQQVLDLIKVRVHAKPAASRALSQLTQEVTAHAATMRPQSAGSEPNSSRGGRVLNAEASSMQNSRRRMSSVAFTASLHRQESTDSLSSSLPHVPTFNPGLRSRPASAVTEASGTSVPGEVVSGGTNGRVPLSRVFRGAVYKASATTFKQRGRAVVRSLTQQMWDDSQDALDALLSARDGSYDGSTPVPASTTTSRRCTDTHPAGPSASTAEGGKEAKPASVSGVKWQSDKKDKAGSKGSRPSSGPEQPAQQPEGATASALECCTDQHANDQAGGDFTPGGRLPLAAEPTAGSRAPAPMRLSVYIDEAFSDLAAGDPGSRSETPLDAVPNYILDAIHADEEEQRRLAALARRSPGVQGKHLQHESSGSEAGMLTRNQSTLTYAAKSTCGGVAQERSDGGARSPGAGTMGSSQRFVTPSPLGTNNSGVCGDDAPADFSGVGVDEGEGLAQERRTVWVRDAVWDPSGITNPLMGGLTSQAVNGASGDGGQPGVVLQVSMPAPVGGLPQPQMEGMPRATTVTQPVQEQPVTPVQPVVPAAAQQGKGKLGGRLVGGRSREGSGGSVGGVLAGAVAAAAGALSPVGRGNRLQSQQTELAANTIPDAQDTATALRLKAMTSFSSSMLLRNRMKLRAAHLGQHTPASAANGLQTLVPDPATIATQGLGSPRSTVEGSPRAQAAAAPLVVSVPSRDVAEQDLTYVTIELPPHIDMTPEVQAPLHSRAPLPPQYVLPPAPAQGVHLKAMLNSVSLGEGLRGEAGTGKYIPAFLRKQRESVQPANTKLAVTKQQWVVPNFSSTMGFQSGMYDEEAEIMYFD